MEMARRTAIKVNAQEINSHAHLLPVTRISLNASTAAAIWKRRDNKRVMKRRVCSSIFP
jgi:hypothetical protein